MFSHEDTPQAACTVHSILIVLIPLHLMAFRSRRYSDVLYLQMYTRGTFAEWPVTWDKLA
jgi:hypothetical protein